MRTNLVLDDQLVTEAMQLTQVKTKREVVYQFFENSVIIISC